MPNNLEPITRKETFMAVAAGREYEKPTPVTREEMFLDDISGGVSDAYTKAETDTLLSGKADLVDGKVPASELPSYVDDVVEYTSVSAFPATGEQGKIYIAIDSNKSYRWSGTEYIPILTVDIWTGTRAQYEALQSDDYDYYFVAEAVSGT